MQASSAVRLCVLCADVVCCHRLDLFGSLGAAQDDLIRGQLLHTRRRASPERDNATSERGDSLRPPRACYPPLLAPRPPSHSNRGRCGASAPLSLSAV